jgi:hypothetical protein
MTAERGLGSFPPILALCQLLASAGLGPQCYRRTDWPSHCAQVAILIRPITTKSSWPFTPA